MDLNRLGLFRLISQKMDWLGQRQEIVAQNIANADTPGFRPSDLKPFEAALRQTRPLAPLRTDASHLVGTPAERGARAERERRTYEKAPDGNAVVLEEQLLKISQTGMDHQLATQLYRKHVGLLKAAIGRGQ